MHTSIAVPNTIEFLDIKRINPLISKCKIKVCYVGDTPNRNRSIITEEVAREIAQSLPGSPIVGYFNEGKGDFEEHNDIFQIKNGKIYATTNTRPYGFVDVNAKVWFEEYLDDSVVYRKYLVTEGYLWTGQYPEAKTILQNSGKPHSLEFDEDNGTLDAFWTKDYNGNKQFFIINEAVISKLCILGEDVEPCFEGASITQYSINEDFKQTMLNFMTEIKNILKEGGTTMDNTIVNEPTVTEPVVEPIVEPAEPVEPVVEPAAEPVVEPEQEPVQDPITEPAQEPVVEPVASYNLEEIPEYVELKSSHEALQTSYSTLEQEVVSLRAFKADCEKKEKQSLIKSFYMLSDEDKKDVIDNIDKYSYQDIKSTLSIMCVDKKVSFTKDDEPAAPITYHLAGDPMAQSTNNNKPSWLKQVDKFNNSNN